MFTGFLRVRGIGEIVECRNVDLTFDDTVKCRIVYFSQFVGGRLVLLLAPLLESLIQFRLLYGCLRHSFGVFNFLFLVRKAVPLLF